MLGSQRTLFDIPDDVTYLNCASMSPQLRAVTAAGERAVRARSSPWNLKAADWFTGADTLRSLVARIMNADDDGVGIVPSVSYGMAIAAANVPLESGQSVVVLAREFPSTYYAWRAAASQRGATVRPVSRAEGESWTEAVLREIDDTTAVVAVPNCHWTDGSLVDLGVVGDRARSAGAALVVDASQSLGAYPLDVAELQPDFLVAVGYKWLLGPYGLGFIYAAPHRRAGVPIEQSWLARAGSEDFSKLVDYTDELRAGARRYDVGEYSPFVLGPMAEAAQRQVLEWSVPAIQESLAALTGEIAQGAASFGAVTLAPAQRVGHMVGIRLRNGLPDGIAATLAAANIHVSVRGDSIRVAPHLYNDARDVGRFLDVLRRAVS